jgi:hypothetical protein
MGSNACFLAARTTVNCYQFAFFNVKLPGFIDHPLVVPVFAQGFALMFFLQRGFSEGDDFCHT